MSPNATSHVSRETRLHSNCFPLLDKCDTVAPLIIEELEASTKSSPELSVGTDFSEQTEYAALGIGDTKDERGHMNESPRRLKCAPSFIYFVKISAGFNLPGTWRMSSKPL